MPYRGTWHESLVRMVYLYILNLTIICLAGGDEWDQAKVDEA